MFVNPRAPQRRAGDMRTRPVPAVHDDGRLTHRRQRLRMLVRPARMARARRRERVPSSYSLLRSHIEDDGRDRPR